ncbi:MAG: hypothetical protein CL572_01160 [Alphaproteobacteria bacterium]|jgi:glycosyltransferase involved in cell wall biosynthesis|nr:hypothetical protein [Alphaproteobacteria bacterium]
MKTVLQILPSLRKINGGVERGALDVAKELAERNFKSVIISSGGDMAEKYKYKGVDHHTLQIEKKGLMNYLSSRAKFEKILSEIKPDVVHIRSRWPAFCFSGIIKKKRIPLVTTYHGTYSGNNFFLKKKYNEVMTSGDVTISISKFIDDHIRYFFPNQKSIIKQINRGIDYKYFDANSVSEIRKEKFLSTLNVSERTHIILLPARITGWKGHNVAIDAVKILCEKDPKLNFVLVMVGSENNKEKFTKRLKKKISKLNIVDRVIFCGNITDMPAVYSVADIVLSTSVEPEAFGRVSAEASAMSKPIIATNHGGSREIIENNVTGWLIEPKNPEELANKIVDVLNLDQKNKDIIGRNAQRKIKEKFSLKQMLNQTLQVYEELIERKKNTDN